MRSSKNTKIQIIWIHSSKRGYFNIYIFDGIFLIIDTMQESIKNSFLQENMS